MSIEARFRLRRGEFTLDVELSVPARGVTAIFGPSGSGKTTLLRAVAGLEHCPGGRLRIGDDIWQEGSRFVPTHQRQLGYVFQEPSLFPHLSVRGNLEYGAKRLPPDRRRLQLEQVAALLGLRGLLARDPAGLSGGERQRVAIGRALLTSPQLLLLDEPLAALERRSRAGILPYLERLHDELRVPVLYVSHAADEVARLADHLVLLEKGSVQASGPIVEMLTRIDLPLAHGDDAEALISAAVTGHDDEYDLTYLEFAGGRFAVPYKELAPDTRVRLRVLARDVSLTLRRQSDTSILNVFPARVVEVAPEGASQVVVRLDANGVVILSLITRKSATTLALEPGKQVYAQVKSVAVLA